jgi:hypothetical protein
MAKHIRAIDQTKEANIKKFKAFKHDWNQLLALLLQGNSIVADTPIELDFLKKHVNDPIDTIMELQEQNDPEFIQAIQRFSKKPYNDEVKKIAQHLWDNIQTQPDLKVSSMEDKPDDKNTFRP